MLAIELAATLGVHSATVGRWINGQTKTPDPRIPALVAQVLGVAVEELAPGRSPYANENNPQKPYQSTQMASEVPPRKAAGGRA
ncbi:MAG: helix-turn-helix transcriptional regulator [Deltaproteobacteria bacterium]|nr:helix-turn-helix transcriptional regulator [Deltaproteobacteria bacterium]